MSNVPDYRGVFLRGAGSQNVDGVTHSSSSVGTKQGDSSREMDGRLGAYVSAAPLNGAGDGGTQHPAGSHLSGNQPFWLGQYYDYYHLDMGNAWTTNYPRFRYTLNGSKDAGYTLDERVEYPPNTYQGRGVDLEFDVSRVWPVSNEFRPANVAVKYYIKAR